MSSESVTSLSDIAYIINSDKASISYAKEAFRDMLGKVNSDGNFVLSSAGKEILNIIYSRSEMKNSILSNPEDFEEAILTFSNLVQNSSSSFYNFIK